MHYWLMKTEPDVYSWDDLVKEREGVWDGVRNFQARNHIRSMKKGDLAFFYHTGDERQIVGIMEVVSEAFPDSKDEKFSAVRVAPSRKLLEPVTLAIIKSNSILSTMDLVRQSRLSVRPVTLEQYKEIIRLGKVK